MLWAQWCSLSDVATASTQLSVWKISTATFRPLPTCLFSLLSHYLNNPLLGSLPNREFSSFSRLPTFKDFRVIWLITVERHIASRGQSELKKQFKNQSNCHPLSPGLHRKKRIVRVISSSGLFHPDASFLLCERCTPPPAWQMIGYTFRMTYPLS